MKRITFIILTIAAILAGSISCQKENSPEVKEFSPMTISAESEGIIAEGEPTKVEMAYKYDLLWQEGDEIIVRGNSKSATFTLKDGKGTTKGTFACETSPFTAGDEVEAFYPSSIVAGEKLVWPATLRNNHTVPMYSKKTLSSTKEQTFGFSSLGSVLQIVFNTSRENITLRSIEIMDGEKPLSGVFTIDADGKANITATDKVGITLDLGESGVALGSGANFFNIAVPAGNYQNLTITFTTTEGARCVMKNGQLNIKHNTVGKLILTGNHFIPAGALSGVFTVADDGSANVKKVNFSKGNLTCDISGAAPEWKFYEHQYDCAANGPASTTLISLFTWGYNAEKSIKPVGTDLNNVSRKTGNLEQSEDWGSMIGDGRTWRTLSKTEWQYLFNEGNAYGNNSRSGKCKYGVTVCGKINCVVLLPDNWKWEGAVGTGWQDGGYPETSTDRVTWKTMEDAGAVCLPAAGYRVMSNVISVAEGGNYWSSSAFSENYAYYVNLDGGSVSPGEYTGRNFGCSVRLIAEY